MKLFKKIGKDSILPRNPHHSVKLMLHTVPLATLLRRTPMVQRLDQPDQVGKEICITGNSSGIPPNATAQREKLLK